MGLQKYNEKRHFNKTPEPPGKIKHTKKGRFYCIQKHDASHLHFDFRLEHRGVLKSWAVPKGPSMHPGIRRLAMEVEDHPISYGNFEGTIPEGEYGGGTVMLWDRGSWEPLDDVDEGLDEGKLHFRLHGERLKGIWVLVRSRSEGGKNQWFIIKKAEDALNEDFEPVDEVVTSVKTKRSMDQIARGKKKGKSVWHSNRNENEDAVEKKVSGEKTSKKKSDGRKLKTSTNKNLDLPEFLRDIDIPDKPTPRKSKKKILSADALTPEETDGKGRHVHYEKIKRHGHIPLRLPHSFKPALATLVDEPPEGSQWIHEVKFDGYRLLVVFSDGEIKAYSRNGLDWTPKIPGVIECLKNLKIENGIIDGELVAANQEEQSDFQALQNALGENIQDKLVYYVFDIINFEGDDLRELPLSERKKVLQKIFELSPFDENSQVRYSQHGVGNGDDLYKQACRLGIEGIVSKRAGSPYHMGRSNDWLKIKCLLRQEFVVVGFTAPEGARQHFGALLLAAHDENGKLRFVGKTGTGFNGKLLKKIKQKLSLLEIDERPEELVDPAKEVGSEKNITWVEPRVVCEVKFAQWTRERILRQAVFQGLREDKKAHEVFIEKPKHTENLKNDLGEKMRTSHNGSKKVKGSVKLRAEKPENLISEVAGIEITKPNKVLFTPEVTKIELARYYESVWKFIKPYLVNRPLAIVRCPDGHTKMCFFQKHKSSGSMGHMMKNPHIIDGGSEDFMSVDSLEGLISLVQIGVLEIHAWGTHVQNLEKPDLIVFDLDPDASVPWELMIETCFIIRDRLKQLKLESFVKTTGGKGFHICVPIKPEKEWDEVKAFCKAFANALEAEFPDRYTSNMAKAKRTGKIFVDYLRNGRGATAVLPYSSRAKENAPVSMPLTWRELPKIERADQFTVKNAFARLKKLKKDPWEGIFKLKQKLPSLS